MAVALSRLQDTYRLDPESISKGIIKGVAISPQLSAEECFELGRVLYNHKDYDHSIDWMKAALSRLSDFYVINETISKAEVLEYLAFSSYMKGNVNDALKITFQILEEEPTHERAQNNIWHYEREIAGRLQGRKRGDDGETVETSKKLIEKKIDSWTDERRTYEILCRGEKHPVRRKASLIRPWTF